MDYLQYMSEYKTIEDYWKPSFKPCYKWITFNTNLEEDFRMTNVEF